MGEALNNMQTYNVLYIKDHLPTVKVSGDSEEVSGGILAKLTGKALQSLCGELAGY